jgi:hypothetical protein
MSTAYMYDIGAQESILLGRSTAYSCMDDILKRCEDVIR